MSSISSRFAATASRWSPALGLTISGALLAAVTSAPGRARAEETQLTVRVLSQGAKYIGTSMGGVRITIRDVETGEILATGTTEGTTGDTRRIMKLEQPHHTPVATEEAAAFRTTLDLDRPRRVEVEAFGPLAQQQAAQRVSATRWVVPGGHVTAGDAWTLVMPGLVVDVLGPPAHVSLGREATVELQANVTMMCGCPIEPGGLWDAKRFRVRAVVKRNGELATEVALDYAGRASQFSAALKNLRPGIYEAAVYAYDESSGNTGVDFTTWRIGR
jgi:hypothetical protein